MATRKLTAEERKLLREHVDRTRRADLDMRSRRRSLADECYEMANGNGLLALSFAIEITRARMIERGEMATRLYKELLRERAGVTGASERQMRVHPTPRPAPARKTGAPARSPQRLAYEELFT